MDQAPRMSISFLTPWLLAGSALLAVPIIIHLILRKKPKQLMFPAFRFLRKKHRVNLQKLRLRHLLLLAMRMLLLLLLCAGLARPLLSGSDHLLAPSAPVALALVFDTSVSMDFRQGDKTLLETAKERAVQLVEELPLDSRIAVFDTAPGLIPEFKNKQEAINQIKIVRIRPDNRPVTERLLDVYQMLDSPGTPALPVLVGIISDRTAASWDGSYSNQHNLQQKRKAAEKKLGRPLPHLYLDVSAKEPRNGSVRSISLKKQAEGMAIPLEVLDHDAPQQKRFQLEVTIEAAGMPVEGQVVLSMAGKKDPVVKSVKIDAAAGQVKSEVVAFDMEPLSTGYHHGSVHLTRLTHRDPLEADNIRYWTLGVVRRRALIITDYPEIRQPPYDGLAWWAALRSLHKFPFDCDEKEDILTPAEVPNGIDPVKYQLVTLLHVGKPGEKLWNTLQRYVNDGGGLVILPGQDNDPAAYNNELAQRVMPAKLGKIKDVRTAEPKEEDVFFDPDWTRSPHPMMVAFKDRWERRDLWYFPVHKYWELEEVQEERIVVPYNHGKPALVERSFPSPGKVPGRVVLYTTAMYKRPNEPAWNAFLEPETLWFYTAMAHVTASHVAQLNSERRNLFLNEPASYHAPSSELPQDYRLVEGFEGSTLATIKIEAGQSQLLVPPLENPGNYTLRPGSYLPGSGEPPAWQRAFSVNLTNGIDNQPAETKLLLDRPESSALETLLGESSVKPLAEISDLLTPIRDKLGQTPQLELLPFLMIGVLLLLAGENLLSNRFYRQESEES
jgi:hypothetical protein